jgi:hypothetical protein
MMSSVGSVLRRAISSSIRRSTQAAQRGQVMQRIGEGAPLMQRQAERGHRHQRGQRAGEVLDEVHSPAFDHLIEQEMGVGLGIGAEALDRPGAEARVEQAAKLVPFGAIELGRDQAVDRHRRDRTAAGDRAGLGIERLGGGEQRIVLRDRHDILVAGDDPMPAMRGRPDHRAAAAQIARDRFPIGGMVGRFDVERDLRASALACFHLGLRSIGGPCAGLLNSCSVVI